jgi:hypothetical protein
MKNKIPAAICAIPRDNCKFVSANTLLKYGWDPKDIHIFTPAEYVGHENFKNYTVHVQTPPREDVLDPFFNDDPDFPNGKKAWGLVLAKRDIYDYFKGKNRWVLMMDDDVNKIGSLFKQSHPLYKEPIQLLNEAVDYADKHFSNCYALRFISAGIECVKWRTKAEQCNQSIKVFNERQRFPGHCYLINYDVTVRPGLCMMEDWELCINNYMAGNSFGMVVGGTFGTADSIQYGKNHSTWASSPEFVQKQFFKLLAKYPDYIRKWKNKKTGMDSICMKTKAPGYIPELKEKFKDKFGKTI